MTLFLEHIIVSLIQANQNMIEHYAGLNMNDINLLRVTPLMRSHYLTKVVNCMTLILDYG